MKIFIRAYGSHLMGMGHLFRIKKIVNKLKEQKNCTITLFTRKYEESLTIYRDINADCIIEINCNTSEKDEILLLKENFKIKYDLCINDQLNTSVNIANTIKSNCLKLISFDDLGNGNFIFDNIINILYPSREKLQNEINAYSYMILNDNSKTKDKIEFNKSVKTIFVNQGAADTWGAIPDIIIDLNLIDIDLKIKVLLGPSFKHFDELSQSLKINKKRIEIFNYTDSVIELAKDCDIAILGAGNTLFEIAALGIPIIASTREDKELITIDRLLKDNIIYSNNIIYKNGLNNLVKNVIEDKSGRKIKYSQNRDLFQYDGLNKIIKLIDGE